jgi:hypothetical protein
VNGEPGETPRGLQERTATALLAVDAAAADRRRKRAGRHADVTVRSLPDGMAELVLFTAGWRFTMTADGVLFVTTPSGVTRRPGSPAPPDHRACGCPPTSCWSPTDTTADRRRPTAVLRALRRPLGPCADSGRARGRFRVAPVQRRLVP